MRHRSSSPKPFTHRDNRAATRLEVRSPLAGQDSVGSASAFYSRHPGDLTRGRHWPGRYAPGGGWRAEEGPGSGGQGWAEPPASSEDAPGRSTPVRGVPENHAPGVAGARRQVLLGE